VSGEAIETEAEEFKVRIMESTEEQPVTLSVTVSLYLVVPATTGVIVGLATVLLLRLVLGDQLYAKCPEPPVTAGDAPNVIEPDTGRQ
jgi:uncharacterized membrane protein